MVAGPSVRPWLKASCWSSFEERPLWLWSCVKCCCWLEVHDKLLAKDDLKELRRPNIFTHAHENRAVSDVKSRSNERIVYSNNAMSEARQRAWWNPDLPVPQGKGTKGPVAQLSPSISPLPRKHRLAPNLADVTHNQLQESVSSKCSRRWVQDTVSLNGIFLFFVIAFGTHFKHGSPVIIMYWQLKITRGIHLKKGGGANCDTSNSGDADIIPSNSWGSVFGSMSSNSRQHALYC